MRVTIIEKNIPTLIKFIDWLIRMVGYTIVLLAVALIFDGSIHIDNGYYGFWALLVVVIIYVLNRTIKPIIFLLTLPITGLTLGIFYPFINVFILKIADVILMEHFDTRGIFHIFVAAILISIMNFLMDKIIMDPFLKRGAKNEFRSR